MASRRVACANKGELEPCREPDRRSQAPCRRTGVLYLIHTQYLSCRAVQKMQILKTPKPKIGVTESACSSPQASPRTHTHTDTHRFACCRWQLECSGSLVPANRKGTAEVETMGDQRLDRRESEARANCISYSSIITHARTAAAGADSEPTTGTDQGSPIERLQGDRVIRRNGLCDGRWATHRRPEIQRIKKNHNRRKCQVAGSRRPGEGRGARGVRQPPF